MKENSRLLLILEVLHRKTDEENYETTASLLEMLKERGFNTDRKTLGKDMQELQEFGIGITKTKSTPNKYAWNKKLFSYVEIQMLIDAVLSSRFMSRRRSNELIGKLMKLVSEYDALKLKEQIDSLNRPKSDNSQNYKTINLISDAIRDKRKIVFKYTQYNQFKEKVFKNNGAYYSVSPYKLFWNDDYYYVIGWSDKHNDVGSFRIDRMERVRIVKRKYVDKPKKFNVDAYASKIFKMFNGEEMTVEIEVKNELMKYIIDRFGLEVETEVKTAETFIARPVVNLSPTFYAWIFQFAGGMKILGPEAAVKGMEDMIKKFLIDCELAE